MTIVPISDNSLSQSESTGTKTFQFKSSAAQNLDQTNMAFGMQWLTTRPLDHAQCFPEVGHSSRHLVNAIFKNIKFIWFGVMLLFKPENDNF
jgi:hypothetical protein